MSGGCLEVVWKLSVGCLEGVCRVSGGCLEGFWKMSGKCLEIVCKVSGVCVEGDWKMSGGCLECVRLNSSQLKQIVPCNVFVKNNNLAGKQVLSLAQLSPSLLYDIVKLRSGPS